MLKYFMNQLSSEFVSHRPENRRIFGNREIIQNIKKLFNTRHALNSMILFGLAEPADPMLIHTWYGGGQDCR